MRNFRWQWYWQWPLWENFKLSKTSFPEEDYDLIEHYLILGPLQFKWRSPDEKSIIKNQASSSVQEASDTRQD